MASIWDPKGSSVKHAPVQMGMINTPGAVRPSESDDLETLALLTLGGKLYDSADNQGYIANATDTLKYGAMDTLDFFRPGFLGGKNFLDFDAFEGGTIDGEIDTIREVEIAQSRMAGEKDPEKYKVMKETLERAFKNNELLRRGRQ